MSGARRTTNRAATRLSQIGTSIFTEISQLAVEHGAINLGQGFPDFEAPGWLKAAAVRQIESGQNQYAPSSGVRRLRVALAERWQGLYGEARDPDREVTVTAGATEALFDAILALVEPGEEVVLFEPCYDAYRPAVEMAGGTVRAIRLQPPDWRFDPEELRAAVGPATKMLIINSPHNPTGKLFAPEELATIAAVAQEHDLLVRSDEVYSEIRVAGTSHRPIATLPRMAERTITVDSMGKTFSVTGWKIGWAIAPPHLTAALRSVHQFVTFTNGTPFQEALADALPYACETDYFGALRAAYDARRRHLTAALERVGLATLPIGGAYFLLADWTSLGNSSKRAGGGAHDDIAFCRRLITDAGVAAIPLSPFYIDRRPGPPLIRFCFAKRPETLEAAAERLVRWAGYSQAS